MHQLPDHGQQNDHCNRLLRILANRVICQPTIGGPSTLRFSSRADLKNVISDAQKPDNSRNRARPPHASCLGTRILFSSNQAW